MNNTCFVTKGDLPIIIYKDNPTSAVFEITHRCNMNCRFCYQKGSASLNDLSLNDAQKIMDEFSKSGIRRIVFIGGEPFLHPEWNEILSYAYGLGIKCLFISNGTAITKELAYKTFHYAKEGIISIHGDEDTHDFITSSPGSYRKAIDGIGNLLEAGFRVGIYYTITRDNYSQLYPAIRKLFISEKLKIDWVAVNRDLPHGAGREYFKNPLTDEEYLEVFRQLERMEEEFLLPVFLEVAYPLCRVDPKYHRYILTCQSGISNITIDVRGNMKFCPVMDSACLGNIFKQSLIETWQHSPVLAFHRSLSWLEEKCLKCKYLGKCVGGCAADRVQKENRIEGCKAGGTCDGM